MRLALRKVDSAVVAAKRNHLAVRPDRLRHLIALGRDDRDSGAEGCAAGRPQPRTTIPQTAPKIRNGPYGT